MLDTSPTTQPPLPPPVFSSISTEVEPSFAEEQYELGELQSASSLYINTSSQRNVSELAPTDGGIKAWTLLAACFIVETVVWAFPSSSGVLLNAYMQEEKFTSQADSSELLPLVGTFSSGFMHCSAPFINPFLHRYPRSRRFGLYVGLAICCASLFGASYASKVRDLFILQGVLYAVGGSLLYMPLLSFLPEWFVRRRGLATGIMFAGTGFGGVVLPLVIPVLVNSYGPSKTIRILSVAVLVLILPCIPFLRPRLPENRVHAPGSLSELGSTPWKPILRDPYFILGLMANTLQGFAYFLPVLWLPVFATDLRLSDTQSSLVIALLNGASVLSRIGIGSLTDMFSPWIIALSTNLFTSLATFVLWGVLSRNFAGVIAYGVTYGALAGGWASIFAGFARPLAKDNPARATSLFGLFMLTRGIGNILSTPISTALSNVGSVDTATGNMTISSSTSGHLGFDVAGGRYAKMIVYVGTCFAGTGAIALVGWGADVYGMRVHRH